MKGNRERRTHYTVLGVARDATQKEIEKAFWLWQQGRNERGISADDPRWVEAAYAVLSDPRGRRDYDRLLGERAHPAWSRFSAEEAREDFKRCLGQLDAGNVRRALSLARRSVSLDPRRALYRSYLGFLTAQTGGCLRRAEHQGRLAYELDPDNRCVAFNLAAIYEMAGMRRRALGIRRRWRRGPGAPFSRRS